MRFFVKIFSKEKYQKITVPFLALVISLIVGAIVIFILGKNPIAAYGNLLQGCGILPKLRYAGGRSMLTDFVGFVNYWTPMIFAALAVAAGLRAGLFNIGVSGQMLAAGFVASVLVGYSTLAAPIAKPLVLLISIAVGGLLGAFVGWLKYKFNINEVVSAIMINYIIQYVVAFLIHTLCIDPVSRQSQTISDEARLTLVGTPIGDYKYDIPLGIVLAVLVVFVIRFVFNQTTFGYEWKIVGLNREAAKYAGINVGRSFILTMLISGALAGLAGATYYMGYFASIQPKVLAPTGYDAIAVALLGGSNPVGILFSSFLISVIANGSTYMSSTAGLDAEVASVIIGLILLFSACGVYMKYLLQRARDKMKSEVE